MSGYIGRRLLQTAFTLILVMVAMFVLLRLLPGNPAQLLAGEFATAEDIKELERAWGLDQPLALQLVRYLVRLSRGDFGLSMVSRQPVWKEILLRYRGTLELLVLASMVGIPFGVMAGIVSAVKPYSLADRMCMMVAVTGISMPAFWLSLLLMLVFSVKLGWLPALGTGGLRHLVLPAVALSAGEAALIARQTRSAMLEVLLADYVRTARAKGLAERVVIYRHALKNALIPVVTVVGVVVSRLLGGSVVIESVFARPGLGKLMVDSIFMRDYAVVEALIFLVAVGVALVNLGVDLVYAYLDPRIRYR